MFNLKSLLVLPFPVSYFWIYRWLINILVLITVTLIVNLPFNNSLKNRYEFIFVYEFGIFMYVLILFCAIFGPWIIKWIDIEYIRNNDKKQDRSFEALWELNAFTDIKECLEYGIIRQPTEEVHFFIFALIGFFVYVYVFTNFLTKLCVTKPIRKSGFAMCCKFVCLVALAICSVCVIF